MNAGQSAGSRMRSEAAWQTVVRWAVGGLFIYLGLAKALHPVEFLKLVHEYHVIENPLLLNAIAAALPWFEVFCGVLLVLGVAVRGTALMLILMLVPFTAVVLRRALSIAADQHLAFSQVKFDCGCGTGEVFIWKKMIENGVLVLLSCALVYGWGRKFSFRFGLFDSERRGAIAEKTSTLKEVKST
jgi:putative oxidoreductase